MKTPVQNHIPPGRVRVKLLSFLASIVVLMTLIPATQGKPTPIHYDTLPTGRNLQSAYLLRDRTAYPWGHWPRPPLQAHFADVLRILERNTGHSLQVALERLEKSQDAEWSAEERADWQQRLAVERDRNIVVLREYRARGLFPINDQDPTRAIPVFVDHHDTACAVGYLMRRSGAEQAVEAIVRANNFVYVTDVHEGPLVDWILTSGLTQEEAALIQPGYRPDSPPIYLFPYYVNEGGTITITGYIEPDGNIPHTIDGLPVTSIAYGAFWGRPDLTNAIIPNSVTNIEGAAFAYCSSLTNIVIPDSVTSLGGFMFFYCSSLTSAFIGNSVKGIGEAAFYGCTGLRNVAIGNSVINIGYRAFLGCSSLTNIVIPDSVTSIGTEAFRFCTSLTTVTIGNGVIGIGGSAFNSCGSLRNIAIPDSVTSVGGGAISSCSSLTNIFIGRGVTNIASGGFWGGRFALCGSLAAITVDNLNPSFSSADGVLFDKSKTKLVRFPEGKVGSYTIPDSVRVIEDHAFFRCFGLSSVIIPDSVTTIRDSAFSSCHGLTSAAIGKGVISIGYSAFSGCRNLANVSIPDSVTAIGSWAFYSCSVITNVTIGNGVASIGSHAFRSCSNLTSARISSSVTSIGNEAFSECARLMAIDVDTLNTSYSSVDGVFFDKNQTTLLQYPAGRAGSYVIPNSVANIEDYAFHSCLGLTSVIIPNTVTRVGVLAFAGCSGLTAAFFQGNVPGQECLGCSGAFEDTPATIYYAPGTSGWAAFYSGRPTAPWLNPLILSDGPGPGVRTNQFGFTISWATNVSVVVEACADFSNPDWLPVKTNTLTGGISYFSDPQWRNHPSRFYRLRPP